MRSVAQLPVLSHQGGRAKGSPSSMGCDESVHPGTLLASSRYAPFRCHSTAEQGTVGDGVRRLTFFTASGLNGRSCSRWRATGPRKSSSSPRRPRPAIGAGNADTPAIRPLSILPARPPAGSPSSPMCRSACTPGRVDAEGAGTQDRPQSQPGMNVCPFPG